MIRKLLDHLATFPPNGRFQSWTITEIGGGYNNRLYRATADKQDIAVKFTIQDERRRARLLYERPLGKDQRLAFPKPEWKTHTEQ